MNFIIQPNKGIGDIHFGMTRSEIESILGNPTNIENSTNALDIPATILHYDELELTLVLEGDNPTLHCIETSNETCLLFGKAIMEMNEQELIAEMKNQGYPEPDTEDEPWGERSISYEKNNIDFFFEEDELISIVFTK